MDCPVCGKKLSFEQNVCISCGQDLSIYKKVYGASNRLYNDGLEKARLRDLSGAADSLMKSLKLNKKNTSARNLLGLVYYEMGEVAEALSQWVLSKNFQDQDNDADRYMDAIQRNPKQLESINQMIKKYNSALSYAKKGSEDLAIMQLEKAVSLNPQSVKCYQLLALLYMHANENEKAAACLSKARSIDKNNVLTAKYAEALPGKAAVKGQLGSIDQAEKEEKKKRLKEKDISPAVFSGGSYREDKFNIWPYINLLIGAAIGIAVVYILIVPTVRKQVKADYETQFKTYSDQMNGYELQISDLENEKNDLKEEKKALKAEIKKLKESGISEKLYDYFFQAVGQFLDGDKQGAAETLIKVEESALDHKSAREIYKKVKEATFEEAAERLAEEGRVTYNNGRYDDAIVLLEQAIAMDPDSIKGIYFLGRAYHRKGDADKAKKYYNKIINDYPDSDRVYDATRRLAELGNE